jgi:hypothetical protein
MSDRHPFSIVLFTFFDTDDLRSTGFTAGHILHSANTRADVPSRTTPPSHF